MGGRSFRDLKVVGLVAVLCVGVMLTDRAASADEGEEWTDQFGTSNGDYGHAVAVDATGVYVTGTVTGALPGQTSAGLRDVFVRKYGTDGTEDWTRQFGTSNNDDGWAVAVNATGVYVTGTTGGVLPDQSSAGRVFVRKYDTDGTAEWTRQFAGGGGRGVAVDATGVYVTGTTRGVLPGQTSAGLDDVFVRKYDTGGTEEWTHQFGTSDNDWGRGVAVDATGVYVTGTTRGVLPGQTSVGLRDVFVRKYGTDGTEAWTDQFGTTKGDYGLAIAVNATGVYVTGSVTGALKGQSNAGSYDVFVRRYSTD